MMVVLPAEEVKGAPSRTAIEKGEALAERARLLVAELDAIVANVTDKAVLRLIEESKSRR